jgi:hypothetical protein
MNIDRFELSIATPESHPKATLGSVTAVMEPNECLSGLGIHFSLNTAFNSAITSLRVATAATSL